MPAPYALTLDSEVELRILPALVWADGIAPPSTCPDLEMLDELLLRIVRGEESISEVVRGDVRAMLRHGTYKPTGRGKPASEFLFQAALRGDFPRVRGPVDVNNAISLASGLPGSIFDSDLSGPRLHLRYGRPGESYVFNPSGQSIDLEDLVVVCRAAGGDEGPCGNPIKDSMSTKIRAETTNVVAVLYVPTSLGEPVAVHWAARFAEALRTACRAREAGFHVAAEAAAG